ncbi:mitosis inhibitor protein kinase swe1 [Microbotryomycetes sp. JL221]|nr:mitosis inhibitor protein kinase swe1 [Microbotryomycetes sp. JL221]
MSSGGYTVDPPTYQAPGAKKAYGATQSSSNAPDNEPLLASNNEPWASGSSHPRNEWPDEADAGDVPDDFKIGVTVSQSSIEVRQQFVRKVYGVLFCQILLTAVVGGAMMRTNVANWVQQNSGLLLIPMIGALVFMGLAFWKRHSHPLNLVFLAGFTACEALTLGSVVSLFDQTIVLQALVITTFVFLGLTLFTIQSKYDFDGMAPYLFGALMIFFFTGIVNLFIPFSRTTDAVVAGLGVLLFSGLIIFDTHLVMRRLHVDDWVIGSISLYLDFASDQGQGRKLKTNQRETTPDDVDEEWRRQTLAFGQTREAVMADEPAALSPRQHVLRPRKSFQRNPFTSKMSAINAAPSTTSAIAKLHSPFKSTGASSCSPNKQTNGAGSSATDTTTTPADSTRGRVKRMLEPAAALGTPDKATSSLMDASISSTHVPASPREPTAGLKKFASSLQDAFTSRGKQRNVSSNKPKQGFDLSDWNHDLAAIESPSGDRSTAIMDATRRDRSPSPMSTRSASNTPKALPRNRPTRSCVTATRDMSRSPEVTLAPTTSTSRGLSTVTRAMPTNDSPRQSLELPTVDTRRRKSEEMDDEDRDVYSSQIASPVRREPASSSHHRGGSLAHAHALRSSRSLASRAHMEDAIPLLASPRPLGKHLMFGSPAAPLQPMHPFSSEIHASAASLSCASMAPPPLKRISVEETSEDDDSAMDDNVFGGGGNAIPSNGKKPGRTKSLSRNGSPSVASGAALPLSNSHPGWTGNGFETAPPPGNSRINSGLASPHDLVFGVPNAPMKTRSRTASSVTALDTLDERGPAPDYFSITACEVDGESSRRPSLELHGSQIVSSTPRRRPDQFSLFGSPLGATGGASSRRGSLSMPDMTVTEEEIEAPSLTSPGPMRRLRSLSNARRQANLAALAMTAGKDDAESTNTVEPTPATPIPHRLVTSRRVASFDSLLQAAAADSPFGRPGTISTPHGTQQPVHASVHLLRDAHNNNSISNIGGRKRNANGALLMGPGGITSSRLGATSPIVAPTSPATWNARDVTHDMDEDDDDDDAVAMEDDSGMWDACLSPPPPPPLTDGTTSASSSLSTSLSSHADGPEPVSGANTNVVKSISNQSVLTSQVPFSTPQNYKNVKPLQAAFMSTGLVSKRSRPRSSSLSGAPVFNLHQHLLQNQLDERAAAEKMAFVSSTELATDSALGLMAQKLDQHPALLPRSSSIMPDTPVKRSVFTTSNSGSNLSHPPLTATALEQVAHATGSDDSADGSPGQRQPTMTNLSPLGRHTVSDSRESSASKSSNSTVRVVPDETQMLSPANVNTTVSPSHSPLGANVGPRGDISPSIHASRTTAIVNASGSKPSIKSLKIKPTLFRRRSSGQLSSEASHLGLKSGGSSSSGSGTIVLEGEPMTPTRTNGNRWYEAGTQLLDTPIEETPITPATPAFPPLATQFAFFPQTTSNVGRSSFPFSDMERRQFALGASRPASSGEAFGRPQFKIRHSSSTVDSLRHHELQQPNWFESNFTILRTLGNGEFSDAYEVTDRSRNGHVFAVKRTKHPFTGPKDRLRRLEEVEILRWFSMPERSSPHLIALVDAWEQINHLFIQTELCANGNLCYFLEEYGREHEFLDEARVWKILNEMVAGVHHLHLNNVIHLDLKPANVFIDVRGHLKLGDFGLATRWPRLDPMSIVRGARVPGAGAHWDGVGQVEGVWQSQRGEVRLRAKSSGAETEDLEREGDREYIAPEILAGRYGKEADIFSLGLIVLEAAANVVLPDNGPAWQKLRSNDLTDVDLTRLSTPLIELLRAMLEKQPESRASIEQIQRFPVVAVLQAMLVESMAAIEHEQQDRQQQDAGGNIVAVPPLLGATVAEAASFLDDVFHAAAVRAAQPNLTEDGQVEDRMDVD